jgi:hypothetical protein
VKTTDIDSITNSVLQVMDNEMRKNGVTTFTPNHDDYRPAVRAMVSAIVFDQQRAAKQSQIAEEISKLA